MTEQQQQKEAKNAKQVASNIATRLKEAKLKEVEKKIEEATKAFFDAEKVLIAKKDDLRESLEEYERVKVEYTILAAKL